MNHQITGTGKPEEYLSYVLRLWCESKQGGGWLSSLQNPITGERIGFACMDELFEFLRNKTSKEEMFNGCKDSKEVMDHNSIENSSICD